MDNTWTTLLRLGFAKPSQAEIEAGQRAYLAATPVRVREWADLERDERIDWIIEGAGR